MKKIFILIYIWLIIFIPIKVSAIEIIETEITGTTEKSVGEEVIIDYKINFDDIEKNETGGIWFLQYELIFDEETLLISEITSDNFESYIYKENDKFRLEFILQNKKMSHYIDVRIRNSGSRYIPFNQVFMKLYNSLQEYDSDYHQIHIEEYMYQKTLKK